MTSARLPKMESTPAGPERPRGREIEPTASHRTTGTNFSNLLVRAMVRHDTSLIIG
jgi:hypothetical protein